VPIAGGVLGALIHRFVAAEPETAEAEIS
jgi:hypothetical protein